MSGETFRKLRTASGVTITEISRRTGISKVRISLWEQGLTRMWPHELESLEKTIVGMAAEKRDQIVVVLGDVGGVRV